MPNISYGGKPSYYDISQRYRDLVVETGFDISAILHCNINILMVTDNADFDDGGNYHLSEVIKAIGANLPKYIKINITTASHHSGRSAGGQDINAINLATENLNKYNQIWFFAVNRLGATPGLEDNELQAVFDFMQAGGGVFATGDHEDLGASLCGRIPRVRSMRRWYDDGDGPQGEPDAPPAFGAGQHETTIGSDFDGSPQTIVPKEYTALINSVIRQKVFPHPVLCGPDGPITVLPDHMHEGAIEVPDITRAFTVNGTNVVEYPNAGSAKLAPEVIATATNHAGAGGNFGVIGAYDGHKVTEVNGGVGRIVVDATWHHYFNTNLNQFRWGFEAAQTAIDAGQTPTADDVTLANHYRQMRAYFQNIAIWLAKKGTQSCIRRRGLWYVRWHIDLQMAILPRERVIRLKNPLRYYYDLGTKAKDAFQRIAPQCETYKYLIHVVDVLEWKLVFDPWIAIPEIKERFDKSDLPEILDPDMAQTLMMGGAMHALAENFGDKIDEKRIDEGEFDEILQKGAVEAMSHMREVMARDLKVSERLFQKAEPLK